MNKYETVADLKNCTEDIIIFGVGTFGSMTIEYLIKNNIKISALCDNDKNKQGTTFCDIQILSLDNVIKLYDNPLFIIAVTIDGADIAKQLLDINVNNYYILPATSNADINNQYFVTNENIKSNQLKLSSDRKLLNSLKDKHKGERCFIIGNGPSLKASDLDKLKNSFSFAANFIYKIFTETDWRPSYYSIADLNFINNFEDKIKSISIVQSFCIHSATSLQKTIPDFCSVEAIHEYYYPNMPSISTDASKGVYGGGTVTYSNIQLAMHMGFSEIIIIGLDHNYSNVKMPNGEIIKTDCKKDHFHADNEDKLKHFTGIAELYRLTLAYEKAREYGDENGIKMLNATRGGKLEVFERVDFDTLF